MRPIVFLVGILTIFVPAVNADVTKIKTLLSSPLVMPRTLVDYADHLAEAITANGSKGGTVVLQGDSNVSWFKPFLPNHSYPDRFPFRESGDISGKSQPDNVTIELLFPFNIVRREHWRSRTATPFHFTSVERHFTSLSSLMGILRLAHPEVRAQTLNAEDPTIREYLLFLNVSDWDLLQEIKHRFDTRFSNERVLKGAPYRYDFPDTEEGQKAQQIQKQQREQQETLAQRSPLLERIGGHDHLYTLKVPSTVKGIMSAIAAHLHLPEGEDESRNPTASKYNWKRGSRSFVELVGLTLEEHVGKSHLMDIGSALDSKLIPSDGIPPEYNSEFRKKLVLVDTTWVARAENNLGSISNGVDVLVTKIRQGLSTTGNLALSGVNALTNRCSEFYKRLGLSPARVPPSGGQ